MNAHRLSILASVSALALVTACSSPMPRNDAVVRAPETSQPAVQYGIVSNIETVPVATRSSGGGALLGAVIGAVVGNQIGSGNGRAAATGVGVVGGAVIGNQIEKRNQNDADIYRVSVRMDNGRIGQFDYQRIDDLRVGDRVKVDAGQLHRI